MNRNPQENQQGVGNLHPARAINAGGGKQDGPQLGVWMGSSRLIGDIRTGGGGWSNGREECNLWGQGERRGRRNITDRSRVKLNVVTHDEIRGQEHKVDQMILNVHSCVIDGNGLQFEGQPWPRLPDLFRQIFLKSRAVLLQCGVGRAGLRQMRAHQECARVVALREGRASSGGPTRNFGLEKLPWRVRRAKQRRLLHRGVFCTESC